MLLDTASLYFRAFYGVPDSFTAPDGTPVNAVRGLLDFMARLIGQYRPTHLVCCWDDDWRPQWRVDLVPSYKAQRVAVPETNAEEVPDLLTPQVGVIVDLLAAFGIARVGVAGHEADDVIGSFAAQSSMPVDIVTGDRDLFQSVDDAHERRVLYVARGVAKHEVVTDAVVMEKYGVAPHQYADFATLRGDASDGLPGVKGVGEKTAAQLLAAYGDLDGILTAAHDPESDLAKGPRAKILGAGEYITSAGPVVAVVRDLRLPDPAATALPRHPASPEELELLARQWGLDGPVKRLAKVLAGD
jgi:5'-3' exonuclease